VSGDTAPRIPRSGRRRPPAYQWYPADFWGDRRVRLMSRAERDMFRELLDSQWLDGPLPKDPRELAALLREPLDVFEAAWARIAPCFVETEDGRLVNPRMARELERLLDICERRSTFGRKGADAKQAKAEASAEAKASVDAEQEHKQPASKRVGKKQAPQASASASAAPSPANRTHPREVEPAPAAAPPSDAGASGCPGQAEEPPTPKRTRKQPTGDHAALMAWWATAWEEARGIAWSFSGKDGAAAKRLLEIAKGDLAAIKARGDRMLCNTNRWHAERASLSHLASQWNELGVEILPAQVNGSGGNGYHRETAAEAAYRKSQDALDRVFGVESRTVLSRVAP
jgi:hypothetical protein